MGVFKAYDIRGVYPSEINEELAYKVGRAIVVYTKAKDVVVGYDARVSSEQLTKSLIRGIIDQGGNVINIGLCPTPLVGFTVASKGFDAGAMITASHSPKEYNGVKLLKKGAAEIYLEDGLDKIKSLVEKNRFPQPISKGVEKRLYIISDYLSHMVKLFGGTPRKTIVVDYSNGVGSITAQKLFDILKIKTVVLNQTPDGTFPNHSPNPMDDASILPTRKEVIKEQADLGVIFDADADRLLLIDGNGEKISQDALITLVSRYEIEKKKNATIYLDLRLSKGVSEKIRMFGGNPKILRVGRPYYKRELQKDPTSVLGAELSGHIMYRENYSIDDPVFFLFKLLNILEGYKLRASEIKKQNADWFQSDEINLTVSDPDKVMSHLKSKLDYKQKSTLDGLTLDFGDWWFNIRKSNTEPLVRLRFEAKTNVLLEEKKKEIIERIKFFTD